MGFFVYSLSHILGELFVDLGIMKRSTLFSIIILIITLIFLELGFRLFTVFPIHGSLSNRVYNEILNYKMDPSLEDIDQNGFRNSKILQTADIVVLGDSHTYGVNVKSIDSFPQQLSKMAGLEVYNFGVSGYGALHYNYLFDYALELEPKFIIIALYPPNDLVDICNSIKNVDYWKKWAIDNGFNPNECGIYKIVENKKYPIFNYINSLFKKTAIGSFTNLLYTNLYKYKINLSNSSVVINDTINPTIIKYKRIANHKNCMNMSHDKILKGFEILKRTIEIAKRKTDSKNIDLIIGIIPSKERVYYDYIINKGYKLPNDYHELVKYENSLVNKLVTFFNDLNIKNVDIGPKMSDSINRKNIYLNSDNGHPNANGYNIYANSILELLLIN